MVKVYERYIYDLGSYNLIWILDGYVAEMSWIAPDDHVSDDHYLECGLACVVGY